jgi:diguanylate cyclase (GGDEF)-like protein
MHAGSGVTSSLILAYVEREAGQGAVKEMLAAAGLDERERELRNENSWFSFETKLELWAAAEAVTGDARIAERVGECALELSVALVLKRALRALGSPDFVYRNVVRANSKFNWAHTLEVVSRESGRVRLKYRDVSGVGYHRYDCEYTTGLLRTIPALFGMPPARVTHPRCGVRGDGHCEFDISWSAWPRATQRAGILAALTAAGLAGVGALSDPLLLEIGGGLGAMTAGLALLRETVTLRRHVKTLQTRVQQQAAEADAQLESLAALSSELRLDKALDRITSSVGTAIGGTKFALLVVEPGRMRADRHSDIPAGSLRRLEQWAQDNQQALRRGPIVLDSLIEVPALSALADDDELPLGSACAAPLIFGDQLLGALIALAPGATVLLPDDVRSLGVYAGHAAIALWNAQLVERLERDAAEDPLTGLANRRVFDAACAAELDRASREGGSVALVMIDIDHFKDINDAYGHPFGDGVLVSVADALRTVVRGHDTVARLGGEEFALLLPGTSASKARDIAERARAVIATIELPDAHLSCSAGVATATPADGQARDLLGDADRALYEAKRQGRRRTVLAATPLALPATSESRHRPTGRVSRRGPESLPVER